MIMFVYTLIRSLISGVGLFALSSMSLTGDPVLMYATGVVFALMFPLRGLCYIIFKLCRGIKVMTDEVAQIFIELVIFAAVVLLPNVSYTAFVVVFELYLTFYIGVKLVDTIIYLRNKMTRYFVPSLCQAVFMLQLFFGIVFIPDAFRERLMIIGVSCVWMLFGAAHLCDFLALIVPNKGFKKVMSCIRLTLPGFMGMSFPHRLYGVIKPEEDNVEAEPNAEVLFQFSRSGIGVAGHCELCIDGKTFTYGNYDPATRIVFRLAGDGIILRAERDRYIDYVVKHNKKVVFSYGLRLDEKQLEAVNAKLDELSAQLVDWSSNADELSPKEFARALHDALGADVFKVTGGDFRTYFAPSINCVQITDYLLRDTDIGRAVIPGVNSPGAYMELFSRLYAAQDSPVVSMRVYGAA